MRKRRFIKPVIIALLVFGVLVLCQDDEPTLQQSLYCEMTQLHDQTNGQHGWPDYKNLKGEGCDE